MPGGNVVILIVLLVVGYLVGARYPQYAVKFGLAG